ncbi:BPSS1780 family membrane protein [Propionivibrio limicola]|uniref:BPSS1780 family membrane protein n=1 Tax=Propionivibrio limicola TaxID=167645 RepID=UPI0012910EA7|nr:BPSS1780 family membrane protein [Propionivibrio limicola]
MSDSNSSDKNQRPIPAAWTKNPFEAPTAHVEDPKTHVDESLASEPNRCEAGRGSAWWGEGWGLFREATGTWIGIAVVLVLINIVLGLIPVIGDFATTFLMPVFGAGLMLGCRSLDSGEELTLGHLFAGFQKNFGQLILVSVFYLVGFILVFLVGFALGFGGGFAGAMSGGANGVAAGVGLAVLVVLALSIPLAMSIWFAPALVALNDVPAFEAMKLSFRGCLRNMLPFLIYGILFILLAIVATIPLALGWLALLPTMFCSTYASYRDIFTHGN